MDTAALMQLAMDPTVQKYAKQAGKLALQGIQSATRPRRSRPRKQQRLTFSKAQPKSPMYRAPVAESRPTAARFRRGSGQGRVSVGTEFLGNLDGTNSATPGITVYELNPGLVATFPRLSKEAEVWEEYRFRRLSVKYTPAVASSTAGTIMLAPEYNSSSAPPTTEAALLNREGAISGNPWAPLRIQFDVSAMHGNASRKFVRDGPTAGGRNNYDAGKLIVASLNNGGTGIMGKLWLEYEVEFFVPHVEATVASTNLVAHYNLANDQGFANGVAEDIAWDEIVQNTFGVPASDSMILPKGAWLIFCDIDGTDSAAEGFYYNVELQYGGASLPIPIRSTGAGDGGAGQLAHTSLHGYVETNGTSAIRIRVTMVGAAGTMVAKADHTRLTCLCVSG